MSRVATRVLLAVAVVGLVGCSDNPEEEGSSDAAGADRRSVDDSGGDEGSDTTSDGDDAESTDSGEGTDATDTAGGMDVADSSGMDRSDGMDGSLDSRAADGEDGGALDTATDPADSSSMDSSTTDTDGSAEDTTDACTADCTNKDCGGDGCGGSCGTCSSGKVCENNQCTTPSFSNDVMPLFNNYGCGGQNCHDSTTSQSGLDLSSTQTAYNNLVGVSAQQCTNRKRVEAGSASNSYLIDKLTGQNLCFGNRMPSGGPYLSSSEIDTIRAWINAGAPNN